MSLSSAKVTLMPLNYNGLELLKLAIPKLIAAAQASVHQVGIVVVDNNSEDDSEQWLRLNHPTVGFMAFDENRMLSTYNDAIARVESPYVMILNNDVLVDENFIDPLVQRMESRADVFSVSPCITADEAHEVWKERLTGRFFHGHLAPIPIDTQAGGTLYFHGAASLVRRDRFLQLGGFDPLFFYQEDNDLSYRAWRTGYCCLFEPSVKVHHLGSQTVKKQSGGLERKRAYKEKANLLFVYKNVQNKSWLLNFKCWNVLKCLKMILTIDRRRAWAYKEGYRFKILMKRHAQQQPRVDDEVLMQKITELKLPSLAGLGLG